MANRRPAPVPVPRVVHYIDPAPHRGELLHPTGAQLDAWRREQRLAYARWAARRAAIAEHDRKVRRFWLGFGAVIGTAVLAGLTVLVWLAFHVLAAVGLLAIPLVLLAVAGIAAGGHRCVTIVQHWH
jgi:hypothetical protein